MSEPLVPVFDLGGVFVDWNPLYLFRKLFETEEEAVWFHENICTLDWNLEFDAGDVYSEGVAKLITRFPRYWREIQAYDQRWKETIGGLIQGTIDIHEELIAAEIPTFAITNFSWEKWVSVLPDWPFLEKFDGVVVSGLERMVKPDLRIYRVFCERYGLAPDACVFIDDNEANVIAARKFGMEAVHFTTPEALRAELVSYGLPLKA
ncbi:HAD family hydrolase [Pelagibacterium xiamenense]|uniref:HAD family hydrolase n=1 Tax=Pelagibacterium xiamenense TaxID=2901140 RepID=UPI001E3533C5|nr:HAD family phosphatase [Pelagibacterium xiamenense]MCD7058863.1 HAD family phosphatase [Pelagibacterium xiamenense]